MRVMRVVAAVVMTLGLAVAPATAQTIGFKIGPTFSKLDADESEGAVETLTSLGGGGFVRFGFAGLALQLELLALTKGAEQTFTDPDLGDVTVELKLNYIEIPLTAMFAFGSGPYVFAGPSVAFEIGCNVDIDIGDGDSFSGDCDDDDADVAVARKSTDFSLVGGAGFEFPAGPGRILIEGRYIYGLTNINDDPDVTSDAKHRTWFVGAGYSIPIGSVR